MIVASWEELPRSVSWIRRQKPRLVRFHDLPADGWRIATPFQFCESSDVVFATHYTEGDCPPERARIESLATFFRFFAGSSAGLAAAGRRVTVQMANHLLSRRPVS
jgi:hypothetical protein